MSKFDEIISVAQQLAAQGKKPSVALLKPLVKAPLPTIISGLKQWQSNPDKKVDLAVEAKLSRKETVDSIDEKIAEAIAPLKKEIEELKSQLSQLQAIIHKD